MFTHWCKDAWPLSSPSSPVPQVGYLGPRAMQDWDVAVLDAGAHARGPGGCLCRTGQLEVMLQLGVSQGRGTASGWGDYNSWHPFFCPFAPCAEAKQKGWRLAAAGWRHPLPISTRRAERKLSAPLQIVILDKRLCNNLRNAREDLALIPYKPSLTSGSLKSNLAELTRAANVEPLDSGERQARLKRPRSLRRGAEGCPCLGGAWDFV